MSEIDGEEQVEVIQPPPREPPGLKFFVAHLNSYTGKALYQELQNSHLVREPEWASHTFAGTLLPGADEAAAEGSRLVEMERTKEFREQILDSDVIIYDLLTNKYEEVDYVIKTLKTAELKEGKTLILLSSVMTWVNTPPKYKVEG